MCIKCNFICNKYNFYIYVSLSDVLQMQYKMHRNIDCWWISDVFIAETSTYKPLMDYWRLHKRNTTSQTVKRNTTSQTLNGLVMSSLQKHHLTDCQWVGVVVFLSRWSPSAMWAGPLIFSSATTRDVWIISPFRIWVLCHLELWPTSISESSLLSQ